MKALLGCIHSSTVVPLTAHTKSHYRLVDKLTIERCPGAYPMKMHVMCCSQCTRLLPQVWLVAWVRSLGACLVPD